MIQDRASDADRHDHWDDEPQSDSLQRELSNVTPEERSARFGQQPVTLLLTGLTGAGKTTLSYALERRLFDRGRTCGVLDGQNLRLGLNKDLGFSGEDRCLIVHLSAPVEVCRERDTQGQYALADSGELPNFPGVTAPYEAPESPDLVVPTHELTIDACVDQLIALLENKGII